MYLAIAGGQGWLYQSIYKLAKQSPAKQRIIFLDYVNYADIMSMSNNADVLIQEIINFKENETDELRKKRIAIAKAFTYSGHLQKIEDFINETHRTDNRQ